MQNVTRKEFAASSNGYNAWLYEKCLNRSVFLVRILPQLEWIRRDAEYLFVFSPNAGKYEPEKTPYLDTFHAMHLKTAESSNFGHAIHFGKQINAAFM